MGWLWDELVQRAGSNTEQQVRASAKRWREKIEPSIKDLTALKLSLEKERASITIKVVPGLPAPLKVLDGQPVDAGKAILGIYQPDLEQFISHGEQVERLLRRLDTIGLPWSQETLQRLERIEDSLDVARSLYDVAKEMPFLPRLFQYDEDILGAYICSPRTLDGRIGLYWGVIGAVAQQIGCSVDELTSVTLIHEMAHAYTHLGADIEGQRWSFYSFNNSDIYVIEGLAQYYLALVALRFCEKNEPNVLKAYQDLLQQQHGPYKAHLPWLDNYSPEIIRAAMLESRVRVNGVHQDQFEHAMQDAADRLYANRQLQFHT